MLYLNILLKKLLWEGKLYRKPCPWLCYRERPPTKQRHNEWCFDLFAWKVKTFPTIHIYTRIFPDHFIHPCFPLLPQGHRVNNARANHGLGEVARKPFPKFLFMADLLLPIKLKKSAFITCTLYSVQIFSCRRCWYCTILFKALMCHLAWFVTYFEDLALTFILLVRTYAFQTPLLISVKWIPIAKIYNMDPT